MEPINNLQSTDTLRELLWGNPIQKDCLASILEAALTIEVYVSQDIALSSSH